MAILGWQDLIVCSEASNNSTGCGFGDLLTLARAVMADLTIVATFFVTIAAVYIGFKLLTSQGNSDEMTKAKDMAWTALKGYFFVLIAWVLVYTISSVLLAPGYSLLTGIK
jgi:hypothetical protein